MGVVVHTKWGLRGAFIVVQTLSKTINRFFLLQAPAEVMAAMLTHLDDMYGGPLRYLESIGFTKEQQQRLALAVRASSNAEAAI